MHASIRRGLQIALVVGGGLVFSAQAHADDTTGVDSILGGNQAVVAVEVPVTVSGNAVSVIGDSSSTDADTASGTSGDSTTDDNTTSGEDSVLGGNQVVAPVQVPVTVGGNAVSAIGDSSSTDASTSSGSSSGESATGENTTSGEDSLEGGNQVVAPVQVPVTGGGNAVSVIGDSSSTDASTTSGSSRGESATGENTTSGEDSLGGGNQVVTPVQVPVTVGGNAVSVIGDSSSTDASTTSGTSGDSTVGDNTTSGEDSVLGGNQVLVPIVAPVTIGGNAISVVGDSSSTNADTTSGTSGGSTVGDNTTSGEDSLGGGNQVLVPIVAPVTIGGNAVSVIGDSNTTDAGTSNGGATAPVEDPTGPTVPTQPTEPTEPTEPTVPTVPANPSDPATPTHPGEVRDDSPATSRGGNVRTSPSELAVMKPATAGLAYTGANTGALLGSAFLLLALGALLLAGTRRRTMTG